jgi:hypothetical protein
MRSRRFPVAILVIIVGCSGKPAADSEHPYDGDLARSTLITALDAWKKGEARKLARARTPIRFEDDDLAAGWRLSDYEIESPGVPTGPHADVEVVLSLRDARGKAIQREARYQVATEPALAVIRSDR